MEPTSGADTFEPEPEYGSGAELSWFDRLKIAITPKSHAEETVDLIYGPEGRGLIPVPQTYEPENAGQVNAYVETKQVVAGIVDKATQSLKTGISDVKSSFVKLGIIAFIGIAAIVAINAFLRR